MAVSVPGTYRPAPIIRATDYGVVCRDCDPHAGMVIFLIARVFADTRVGVFTPVNGVLCPHLHAAAFYEDGIALAGGLYHDPPILGDERYLLLEDDDGEILADATVFVLGSEVAAAVNNGGDGITI